MSNWSFIAQRATTGEFLDWDVPLTLEDLEWQLSAPGSLKATISPDVGALRASDGRLLLEEWGTFIYAEHDGEIRWGGIVILSDFDGDEWHLEAAGFSTYPHGTPFQEEISAVGIDAAHAFRLIWGLLQERPDSNLNVEVTGAASTDVLLGKPAVRGWTEVNLDGQWTKITDVADRSRIVMDASSELAYPIKAASTWLLPTSVSGRVVSATGALVPGGPVEGTDNFLGRKLPFTITVGDEHVTVTEFWSVAVTEDGSIVLDSFYGRPNDPNRAYALAGLQRGVDGTRATDHYEGTDIHTSGGTAIRQVDGTDAEPYNLLWWEHPDCGEELDNLAKTTPFDWAEHHRWAPDRESIIHEVELGYPRLGRRRDDISFSQGDNVTNVVPVASNGDEFANAVIGLGAGEGTAMVRRETGIPDGRLRRVYTYADKAVTDSNRLDALIADELNSRRAALRIESIDVIDHSSAPLGSWQVGDDVLVRAELPWLGEVAIWCRITGWKLTGENTATLTLVRSDLYSYGGVSPDQP